MIGDVDCSASQQILISVSNPPSIQITLAGGGDTGDVLRLFGIGELAMVPAQPLHSAHEGLDGSPYGHDDFTDDEFTDNDVVSLLEENARLRKLVVRLSEIVLRNVVDAK